MTKKFCSHLYWWAKAWTWYDILKDWYMLQVILKLISFFGYWQQTEGTVLSVLSSSLEIDELLLSVLVPESPTVADIFWNTCPELKGKLTVSWTVTCDFWNMIFFHKTAQVWNCDVANHPLLCALMNSFRPPCYFDSGICKTFDYTH